MKQASVTIRTSDELVKSAEAAYGAKVTGFQIAVEAYFELQRRTMMELKGKFTREELSAMADNQNGSMLQTQFGCDAKLLWWQLEDGDNYDGLFQKWGVDGSKFEIKIKSLTSAQTWFLQDAIRRFWESRNPDLEAFINSLI